MVGGVVEEARGGAAGVVEADKGIRLGHVARRGVETVLVLELADEVRGKESACAGHEAREPVARLLVECHPATTPPPSR